MSLFGAGLAGMTGAGQYYLARKERQRALKNTVDLENYKNALLLRKIKEEQKLKDKINEYNLKKHALDLEAQNQAKAQLKAIEVAKDAALHGSKNSAKWLKERYGIDVSDIKYPIGKPKPWHLVPPGQKLTGYSTQLKQVNDELKKIESKYVENVQSYVKNNGNVIGFKTTKKVNWANASPADRKKYIELQNRKNQILARMSQIQKLPGPPSDVPLPFNEGQIMSGISGNQYGPGLLSPAQIQKINQAGLTEYDIQNAIKRFRAEHPEVQETDYQLIQRIVNGL